MKSSLFLLLAILPVTLPAADAPTAPAATQRDDIDHDKSMSPADKLAAHIIEITSNPDLPAKKKAKLIASAVRGSFLAATTEIHDPAQLLTIALEFASVATKAAPEYAELIGRTISAMPQLAAIPDSPGQISATVEAAALSATTENVAVAAPGQAQAPLASEFGGPVAPEVFVVSQASVPAGSQ